MSFKERAPTDCSQRLLSDPTQQLLDCCSALLEPGQVLQVWRMAYRGLESLSKKKKKRASVQLASSMEVKSQSWPVPQICCRCLYLKGKQQMLPISNSTQPMWNSSNLDSFFYFFSPLNPQILRNLYLKAKTYPVLSDAANTLHYSHGRTYLSNPVYILNTNTSCC